MMSSQGPHPEYFSGLTDDYLLEIFESGTLTPVAEELAGTELSRRKIPHSKASAEEDESRVNDGEPVVLETVARSYGSSQLEILRARLEVEGIPAFVMDGNVNQAYSLISPAMGGARLQVSRHHVAEANEIIASINSGAFAANADDVDGQT